MLRLACYVRLTGPSPFSDPRSSPMKWEGKKISWLSCTHESSRKLSSPRLWNEVELWDCTGPQCSDYDTFTPHKCLTWTCRCLKTCRFQKKLALLGGKISFYYYSVLSLLFFLNGDCLATFINIYVLHSWKLSHRCPALIQVFHFILLT